MEITTENTLPLVTIMVPVYNQEEYVKECLESALRQTYSNIEIIVSDDCSVDNTFDVIKPYISDPKIKYCKNDCNIGRVNNYKKILYEYAKGEWVLNLDGDDFLIDETFISDAIKHIQLYSNVVAVVGGQLTNEAGLVKTCIPTKKAVEVIDGFSFFLSWNASTDVFPHLACLYKRSVAITIDFYRYNILSSDWESLRRLILHGNLICLGRAVGVWRGHGDNATKTKQCGVYIANLASISAPYDYALKLGFPAEKLIRWKRGCLAEYISSYAKELIISVGLTSGIKLIKSGMTEDRSAIFLSVFKLMFNVKFWARYLLRLLFGEKTMHAVRTCWRKAMWS